MAFAVKKFPWDQSRALNTSSMCPCTAFTFFPLLELHLGILSRRRCLSLSGQTRSATSISPFKHLGLSPVCYQSPSFSCHLFSKLHVLCRLTLVCSEPWWHAKPSYQLHLSLHLRPLFPVSRRIFVFQMRSKSPHRSKRSLQDSYLLPSQPLAFYVGASGAPKQRPQLLLYLWKRYPNKLPLRLDKPKERVGKKLFLTLEKLNDFPKATHGGYGKTGVRAPRSSASTVF